jgi:hypothetical protein
MARQDDGRLRPLPDDRPRCASVESSGLRPGVYIHLRSIPARSGARQSRQRVSGQPDKASLEADLPGRMDPLVNLGNPVQRRRSRPDWHVRHRPTARAARSGVQRWLDGPVARPVRRRRVHVERRICAEAHMVAPTHPAMAGLTDGKRAVGRQRMRVRLLATDVAGGVPAARRRNGSVKPDIRGISDHPRSRARSNRRQATSRYRPRRRPASLANSRR